MSETNYPGIDYSGPGSTANRDKDTGIRYGIISQHSVMGEAADDITTKGDDLGFQAAEECLRDKLREALEDYFSDYKDSERLGKSRLDKAVDDAFDALDGWADNIDFNGPWQLEEGGYALRLGEDGDIWIFKSPYFTYAQFCSPCAPGACHLANPLHVTEPGNAEFLSNKCYCLGHDFFEDGAPYTVYRVSDGSRVEKE